MTTITIPRADYDQQTDDDGRDYYALRTIETAAALGWADDQHMLDVTGERDDDGRMLVFAWVDAGNIAYNTVQPDDEMDGMYPADDLPFTIKQDPGPAWTAGTYLQLGQGQVYLVTGPFDDATDDCPVLYVGGQWHGARGSIGAGTAHLYTECSPL